MDTLNIIGAGKVGKTLAKLFIQKNLLEVKYILNSCLESSQRSVFEIQSGRPIKYYTDMLPANVYMISTNDENIKVCAEKLKEFDLIDSSSIVFHCSGSLSSEELACLKIKGAKIASVHPIRSFANSNNLIDLAGTYCAIEGDPHATNYLSNIFQSVNSNTFIIQTQQKNLYHAGIVLASNYIVSLIELSLKTLEVSGINRELGNNILEPLVRGVIDNIFNLGTTNALTGPIIRADKKTIEQHLDSLSVLNINYSHIYKLLGAIALDLATSKYSENAQYIEKTTIIKKLFS